MSFVEDFYESAAGRVATYAFAAVTSVGLTGCLAGVPIKPDRILMQNVTGVKRDVNSAIRSSVMGAARLTPCTNSAPTPQVDRNGSLTDQLNGIVARETTVRTTGVAVGDPRQCNNTAPGQPGPRPTN